MSDDEYSKKTTEEPQTNEADQYPVVKRKTLDLTEKIEGINIEVCNPVTREEKLTKHTVYTIRGSDKEGAFESIRRYSDFDKIRSLLVLRWPGVYIPPLPPKNTMNKMEVKFIEERKRALDHFCKNVGSIPYLHYSEEFQLFIRSSTPDIEKSIQIFQKINYEDIIAKYSATFQHLSGRDLTNETILRISGFKLSLTKMRGHFETYKKISRGVANAKRAYYSELSQLHSMTMVPYEKNVFSEYHGNKEGKNVFNEPTNERVTEAAERLKQVTERYSYEYINEWMEAEARDIDAFLEALNQREKYDTLKLKMQEREKSENEDLHKIVAGKKTIKSMFSKKNKEEEVSDQEKTIAATRKTLEELSALYDMMTLIVAYEEIDKFKSHRIKGYYKTLGAGAGNEVKNLEDLTMYWSGLLSSENIKSL